MRLRQTILYAIAALLANATASQSQQSAVGVQEVEAAFLYNFTQFVSWEDAPARDTTLGFRIGIYGDDHVAEILDAVVEDEKVGTLPIHVVHSNDLARLDSCQLVFVRSDSDEQMNTILNKLGRKGILTVGKHEGFAKLGGAIEFVIERNRVNFIINMRAIRASGLDASSKLQSVAKQVLD